MKKVFLEEKLDDSIYFIFFAQLIVLFYIHVITQIQLSLLMPGSHPDLH